MLYIRPAVDNQVYPEENGWLDNARAKCLDRIKLTRSVAEPARCVEHRS